MELTQSHTTPQKSHCVYEHITCSKWLFFLSLLFLQEPLDAAVAGDVSAAGLVWVENNSFTGGTNIVLFQVLHKLQTVLHRSQVRFPLSPHSRILPGDSSGSTRVTLLCCHGSLSTDRCAVDVGQFVDLCKCTSTKILLTLKGHIPGVLQLTEYLHDFDIQKIPLKALHNEI